MRKFLALLAAVCILSLVGCTVSSDGDLQKEIAYESRIQAEQSSIMAHIAESDAAIKTTRTFGKEPLQSYLGYRYNPLHSHQVAFNEYNASYEIEFIRQISDTRIYCVQKVLNGYFFTFWYGGWDNGNVRDDGWLYNAAYIQKSLEWKAFSSIKEGANSADVGKIDPAVSEWIDIASQYDSPSIQATLILKDGLLVLDFSKQKNAYTVQQISFYADFKLMSVSGEVIYDYSILPQDYPG